MHYLDVSLELPENPKRKVALIFLKKNIIQAVKILFGEERAKSVVDILRYNSAERRFILRCGSDNYVQLRAALTAAIEYENEPCIYIVHRASPNLLSLTADSRSYIH
ncbi:ribonuclease P protein subunit p14 [Prorops nasuta]|uniref:ribonuclease P protein subunit p14 n=1 Tax=Prorops nasuta TaxID=863751 RepID=UPI0034CDD527